MTCVTRLAGNLNYGDVVGGELHLTVHLASQLVYEITDEWPADDATAEDLVGTLGYGTINDDQTMIVLDEAACDELLVLITGEDR